MHEMSIAQSLMEIVQEEMHRHQAQVLRSVTVHIGQLSAIPEALTFCFQVMTTGTEFEGAKLITKVIPLEGRCGKCGQGFEIKDYAFVCPHCGGTDITTEAGQDLSIVEMEVD